MRCSAEGIPGGKGTNHLIMLTGFKVNLGSQHTLCSPVTNFCTVAKTLELQQLKKVIIQSQAEGLFGEGVDKLPSESLGFLESKLPITAM